MSLHVAHNGNGKTKVLAQTRPQLNAGPAGHDLVGIRDGARLGIDDTCGTDTDTKDLDIGIRLNGGLDGRLDTLEDGLAALLGLGGNLSFKDRMGHAAISRILHNGSRNLSAADIDGANVLVLHVVLLRRQKQLQEMRRQASRHSAVKVFQVPEIAEKPCGHWPNGSWPHG